MSIMFKVMSILPETTMFLVEDVTEIAKLLKIFKPCVTDIYLYDTVVQLHVPAQKSLQIIAEDTEKYKWVGDENDR